MKLTTTTPYQNLSGDRIVVLDPAEGPSAVWDEEHGVERFSGDAVEAHHQAHLISQRERDDIEYS